MNTYIHRVIHTLITSMKWNSWIIEHLFDNFVYGIETASKFQAYLITPT